MFRWNTNREAGNMNQASSGPLCFMRPRVAQTLILCCDLCSWWIESCPPDHVLYLKSQQAASSAAAFVFRPGLGGVVEKKNMNGWS